MPEKLIVLYHADAWCGHCKVFRPDWEKIKFIIDKIKKDYKYIEYDADGGIEKESPCGTKTKSDNVTDSDEKKVIKYKDKVQGYPTIVLFEDSKVTDYNKARDMKSVIDFMDIKADNMGKLEKDACDFAKEKCDIKGGSSLVENLEENVDEYSDGNFDQCGGGNICEFNGGKSNNETYYKMKYYKYKAKYIGLKNRYN